MRVAPLHPRRPALAFAFAFAFAACGNDGPDDPGEPTPITERAGTLTHQCRVDRERTDHSPRQWAGRQAMVTTAAGAYLARVEAVAPNPLQPLVPGRGQLVVSRVAADGTFGTSVVISNADPETLGSVALAPTPAGFTAVWTEGTSLRLAGFDAQGAITTPARTLAAPSVSREARPLVAAGPDGGFGIVYRAVIEGQPSEVRFLALDAAGAPRAPARKVGTAASSYADPGAAIAASADGYALLWRGPSGMVGQIEFAKTDLQGAEVVAARPASSARPGMIVGGTTGFDPTTTALLAVDGGYLAAWTEVHQGPDFMSPAWSIVRVGRLSADGVLQGAGAALRAPLADFDEVEPSLVRFGEAVAVLWGRGSHIYICGGCVPDHRIDLMLIDPRTLDPLSNVVSVTNAGGLKAGGLLRREVAVLGSSLLTTFNLTFHVHQTPGSATFACEPRGG